MPLAGGTLVGDLKFTDATYDIGKSGATRPRDGFFSRNFVIGGTFTVGTVTGFQTNGKAFIGMVNNQGLEIVDSGNGSGAGYLYFTSNSTVSGSITRVGTTAAVADNTTSDRRLKNDHGLAVDIKRLRSLEIHDFDWKNGEVTDRGVFAQQAVLFYPLAVTPGLDDLNADGGLSKPWSVDYSKFVPDLIVGWQQHEIRLAALERKLERV